MIVTSLLNFFLIIVITGYSYIFKSFINKSDAKLSNLDLLYGIFFLIFISLLLNFIYPLKFFFFLIVTLGFFFFLYCLYKKKIKFNYFYYFPIIFVYIFIIYRHGDNIDSPMYHHQIIKWLYNYKISLGLTNLEIRFGDNSLWFNFLSLFQIKTEKFNSIFTLNIIPFVILTHEIFNTKKSQSYLFLNLSLTFIFFFSFLHPYRNGIILNHLHNPEVDTVAMIFFIMSFYLMLMFLDEKKKDTFYLLLLSASICVLTKISYIGVILFPIFILVSFYKKNYIEIIKSKVVIFVIVIFLFWFLKNFLVSGCFIFPFSLSCFNVNWSVGIDEIDHYSKVVKGFARDTRDRLSYLDFDHTINSFNWIIPWIKDYLLNTALLKISIFIVFCSSFLLIFFKMFTNFLTLNSKNINTHLILIFLLLINLLIWFQAPEIRFGWGTIITINCYLVSTFLFFNIFFEKINPNLYKFISLFFFLLLFSDNLNNLKKDYMMRPYTRNFNYNKIEKIYDLNKMSVYQSRDRMCYDFPEICVNTPKEEYFLSERLGYLIFTKYQKIDK